MDRDGYTDILHNYIASELDVVDNQNYKQQTMLHEDSQNAETDAFNLSSEFYLDDSIVAECAEYWAPHYLHKDGTLSPELVQIISDLNAEQVNQKVTTTKQTDKLTNAYCQSSTHDALNFKDQNGKNHDQYNDHLLRNVKDVRDGNRRRRIQKVNDTCKRQKSCKRKNIGASTIHSCSRDNAARTSTDITSEDNVQQHNEEMNEEQKTELVEQLVRLIKDQTKELEEHKVGNNHQYLNTRTKSCSVPSGWERICINKPASVVYLSPSGELLSNMMALQSYLMRAGTCKCGIDCPLIIDQTFNFDPLVLNTSVDSSTEPSASRSTKHSCSCNLANGKYQQQSTVETSPTKRARGRPRKNENRYTKSSKQQVPYLSAITGGSDLAQSISDILRQSLASSSKTVRKRSHNNNASNAESSYKLPLSSNVNTMANGAMLVPVTSESHCLPTLYSKQDEALAIRQLFKMVTNNSGSDGKNIASDEDKQNNKNLLDKEFLPNVDLLRTVDDPSVHKFAKHLIFTEPCDNKNSFSFDVVKPKNKSRRNKTESKKLNSDKGITKNDTKDFKSETRSFIPDPLPPISVLNCEDGSTCTNNSAQSVGSLNDNMFDLFNTYNDELSLFDHSCSAATNLFNRTEVTTFEENWPGCHL